MYPYDLTGQLLIRCSTKEMKGLKLMESLQLGNKRFSLRLSRVVGIKNLNKNGEERNIFIGLMYLKKATSWQLPPISTKSRRYSCRPNDTSASGLWNVWNIYQITFRIKNRVRAINCNSKIIINAFTWPKCFLTGMFIKTVTAWCRWIDLRSIYFVNQ